MEHVDGTKKPSRAGLIMPTAKRLQARCIRIDGPEKMVSVSALTQGRACSNIVANVNKGDMKLR